MIDAGTIPDEPLNAVAATEAPPAAVEVAFVEKAAEWRPLPFDTFRRLVVGLSLGSPSEQSDDETAVASDEEAWDVLLVLLSYSSAASSKDMS